MNKFIYIKTGSGGQPCWYCLCPWCKMSSLIVTLAGVSLYPNCFPVNSDVYKKFNDASWTGGTWTFSINKTNCSTCTLNGVPLSLGMRVDEWDYKGGCIGSPDTYDNTHIQLAVTIPNQFSAGAISVKGYIPELVSIFEAVIPADPPCLETLVLNNANAAWDVVIPKSGPFILGKGGTATISVAA